MKDKLEKSVVNTVNVARSGAEQAVEYSQQHKTARNFLGAVLLVCCLILTTHLLVNWYSSLPPDPNEGDVEEAVRFVQSEAYYDLNDDDRQMYFETIMRRVSKLPKEQRKALREKLTPKKEEEKQSFRKMMFKVGMDYMTKEAREYVNTPEEEREKWVEGRMNKWQSMFAGMGGGRGRGGPRGEGSANGDDERTPEEEQERRIEQQKRIIKFMRENMLPNTDAQQRAQVMFMMSDIGKRQREKDAREAAGKDIDESQL